MLSKSSARRFLVFGTLLFSLIFLALTVDTLRQIPERTNQDKLTEKVVNGKRIWEENNCMGCHTILGEGAYYAPELTKVYERRGPTWMKIFLKDPQAMFPGQRKMVQYDFNEKELDELIAFFEWIGNIDANGFPKKPYLQEAIESASNQSQQGAEDTFPEIYKDVCVACHKLNGSGGTIGPVLDGIGTRMTPEQLLTWLKNPSAVKADAKMPNLELAPEDLDVLVSFLQAK